MVKRLANLTLHASKQAYHQRGFAEQRIVSDWKLIVGDVIAHYSQPKKLIFPRGAKDKGTLTIEVYDSAFATELHFLAPLILGKIATYFGYKAVAQITLQHRPLPSTDETLSAYRPSKNLSLEEQQQLENLRPKHDDSDLVLAMEDLIASFLRAKYS